MTSMIGQRTTVPAPRGPRTMYAKPATIIQSPKPWMSTTWYASISFPRVSPTFVLMKEYDLALPTATGIKRIYHADAYRIDTPLDFEKIGFSEWLSDREGVVLLEWPEKVEDLLPEERCEITLTLGQEDIREVRIAELKRHAEACETGCKTA